MQTYPVDIDTKQLVRWVIAEQQQAIPNLRTNARTGVENREIPLRPELHLGDEEREDLSEVATVATLEIAPAHAAEGWRLTVVVEDEVGPRGDGADTEVTTDVGTFYSRFLRPERGSASVVAEVESDEAAKRVTRLIESVERNRH